MAWNRLRVARTTEALRGATTYLLGELIMPTDGPFANHVFLGDGATVGGKALALVSDATSGLRGAISGLQLANNATDATNDIDIFAGSARDSTNTYTLALGSGITKRLDAAWSAGSGNGGIDTGSKANSTSYHVHLIRKDSDGTTDALFSTSPTAPTMPSGYTARRRIGAIITDGSGVIRPFRQINNWFHYVVPVSDISTASNGTTPVLRSLSVPSGIKVEAQLFAYITNAASAGTAYLRDPDLGAPAGSSEVLVSRPVANQGAGEQVRVWTSTARQIYTAENVNGSTITISTQGWFDHRDEYLA